MERLQNAFAKRGMGSDLSTDEMVEKFIQQEDDSF
jgi:hypothetical protein